MHDRCDFFLVDAYIAGLELVLRHGVLHKWQTTTTKSVRVPRDLTSCGVRGRLFIGITLKISVLKVFQTCLQVEHCVIRKIKMSMSVTCNG